MGNLQQICNCNNCNLFEEQREQNMSVNLYLIYLFKINT